MTYRVPLTREDAGILEWESLVGELGYTGYDIKCYVESRNYADFFVSVTTLRVVLDELDARMRAERDKANIESLTRG